MTEPATTTKTPDASLSLLHRLVEDAMDPGYREAQQRRDPQRAGWRSSIVIGVVLCLLAILVVAAVMLESVRESGANGTVVQRDSVQIPAVDSTG